MSFVSVVSTVADRVVPDESERATLESVVADLLERAETAIADLPVEADPMLVGSTARDTWLAGTRDIDLFIRFSPGLDRADLKQYGMTVGHTVLPDGHAEFAEHPYVHGEYREFAVDCVPCYAVDDATEIQSAVDRTPFHTTYLTDRIDPFTTDVRVLKAFLLGIGAYGSDLRTKGFSGFLTELLILEHGGFRAFIEAAADWQPPVRIDPRGHSDAVFDAPLVMIDPTDPERNVAAVCSAQNIARVIHYARDLSAEPREALFEPRDPDPLSPADIRGYVSSRATTPVGIRCDAPDIVEDHLYPQLEKSLTGVEQALSRGGFNPIRSMYAVEETVVLLVECTVDRLPAVERHHGPPVGVRAHAEDFFSTYESNPDVSGPFIDDEGHYVVERPREARTPATRLEADLFDVALGPDVKEALADDYEILTGTDIAVLADEFGPALAAYFNPSP